MSREIDYWAIREAVVTAIHAHEDLADLPVLLEQAGEPAPEMLPVVLVYLDSRSSPQGIQRIAAGTRTDMRIILSLWLFHYSLNGMAEAIRLRDAVLSKLEIALMRDRTLGGLMPHGSWIEGGDIMTGRDAEGRAFVSGVETRLVGDVYAML